MSWLCYGERGGGGIEEDRGGNTRRDSHSSAHRNSHHEDCGVRGARRDHQFISIVVLAGNVWPLTAVSIARDSASQILMRRNLTSGHAHKTGVVAGGCGVAVCTQYSSPRTLMTDLVGKMRDGARRYATLTDQASRTMVRAEVLHLLDQLELGDPGKPHVRRVEPSELASSAMLRGAVIMQLDLVFRASVSASEIAFTAERGILRVAEHRLVGGFPIGVVLAQPTNRLVRHRKELFRDDAPTLGDSPVVMPYALAASPPRLGAGAGLLRAVVADCAAFDSPSRVVTFSPLTGMRARVIRLVDDSSAWAASAEAHPAFDEDATRSQLLDLLEISALDAPLPEPARSWLAVESRLFAESHSYGVGNFHRRMGASLAGLTEAADPQDSDAMWARAYFDYGDLR